MDSFTENRTRLSFARICIEVDLSSKFPKTARLNLGNGRYTTIRIEYPWVPHNCSHCQVFGTKIAGHGNCDNLNADSGTKILHAATPDKEWRNCLDSVVDSIGTCQSIVIQDKIRVTIPEANISPMRHANRFEYIAISEQLTDEVARDAFIEASTVTPDEGADVASTGITIFDIAEYFDSSPICDSFKQVKRIDELDFTPQPLPLSKSKLFFFWINKNLFPKGQSPTKSKLKRLRK